MDLQTALVNKGFDVYVYGEMVRNVILEQPTKGCSYNVITNADVDTIYSIAHGMKWPITFTRRDDTVYIGKISVTSIADNSKFFTENQKAVPITPENIEVMLKNMLYTVDTVLFDVNKEEFIINKTAEQDIKDNVLRLTGNPYKKIKRDPKLLLNTVYLKHKHGYKIAKDTEKALMSCSHLLAKQQPVNNEYINWLLDIITTFDKPSKIFKTLSEYRLLSALIPQFEHTIGISGGGDYNSDIKREDVFTHLLDTMDYLPKSKPALRLAGLFHDIGKPSSKSLERMKDGGYKTRFIGHEEKGGVIAKECVLKWDGLDFTECKYIETLIKHHMIDIDEISLPKLKKVLQDLRYGYVKDVKDLIRLKLADQKANRCKPNPTRKDAVRYILKFREAENFSERNSKSNNTVARTKLAVNGNDVMTILGIKQGPKVGYVLQMLEDVIDLTPHLNNKVFLTHTLTGMASTQNGSVNCT